jgi:hypothetical protein
MPATSNCTIRSSASGRNSRFRQDGDVLLGEFKTQRVLPAQRKKQNWGEETGHDLRESAPFLLSGLASSLAERLEIAHKIMISMNIETYFGVDSPGEFS